MLKKTLLFLMAVLVLSCSKDDSNTVDLKKQELIEKVHGLYRLRAATTSVPIDINLDGVPQTNLFEEVRYCNNTLNLVSYSCKITHRSTYDEIIFEVPTSEFIEHYLPTTCIRDKGLAYPFEFDVPNNTIKLGQSDHWDEFAADFKTEILTMTWEEDWVYFTLKKEFYTSSGEWQEVELYLEYEKTSDVI